MNDRITSEDSYQSLLLLEEIAKEENLSQRDLSKRMGIALGLVNSYVKNMISKGYIRVKTFPKNRYKYLLTPKGITEKSRLTYQHLHYFTNLYTAAREDFRHLYSNLEKNGVKKVLFCGVDEVAEIAYLSLQETRMELAGVIDINKEDERFFDHIIRPLDDLKGVDFDRIILTSFKKQTMLSEKLKGFDVEMNRVCKLGKN